MKLVPTKIHRTFFACASFLLSEPSKHLLFPLSSTCVAASWDSLQVSLLPWTEAALRKQESAHSGFQFRFFLLAVFSRLFDLLSIFRSEKLVHSGLLHSFFVASSLASVSYWSSNVFQDGAERRGSRNGRRRCGYGYHIQGFGTT